MNKMNGIVSISALRFPVTVQRGENDTDVIPVILTKEQLNAAQLTGQSSKELIRRICGWDGYKVLDIGKADRRTFEINLSEMWWY